MYLEALTRPMGPGEYYSDEFRNMIEDNLSRLVKGSAGRTVLVEPGRCAVYRGDFYGLLAEMNIPTHLHWIHLRMNGMRSPQEFMAPQFDLLLLDENQLARLHHLYQLQNTEIL